VATVHVFLDSLMDLEKQLARLSGTEPTTMPKDLRVMTLAITAMTALLVKALNDNGVLSVAQLNAAVAAAKLETWSDLPNHVDLS
jgi:hypothetical protein